jgi:hypothetical protein
MVMGEVRAVVSGGFDKRGYAADEDCRPLPLYPLPGKQLANSSLIFSLYFLSLDSSIRIGIHTKEVSPVFPPASFPPVANKAPR